MEIIEALRQEEAKLQRQLTAIQGAITVFNDGGRMGVSSGHAISSNRANAKRTMSASARAKIARAAKTRWAKIRAEKAKKAK